MIAAAILKEVLDKALSTGADFAEIFAEHTQENSTDLIDEHIDSASDRLISGVGIRIFKGTRSVSGSVSSMERSALLDCASRVASVLNDVPAGITVHLKERIFPNIHPIRIVPFYSLPSVKTDYLKECDKTARKYSKEILQVSASIASVDHRIMIANSEGLLTHNRQIRTRIFCSATAGNGTENQSGYRAPGASVGMELLEQYKPDELASEAARMAVTMLHAGYIQAGSMPVAIENGFGGVIFHEACGHSLEASAVAVGQSQFAGKLGQQIANSKLTAIDDGTIPNGWGSINIDDEGTPSQRKVLIENGILKSYMIDKLNGRRMNMKENGSCRRQSYQFEPTSRMTNTFIAEGPDRNEDIIRSIEYGLYAKTMGGGSVNPVTGEFNFSVSEGYIIKDGEITTPVRGASLIGKGSEILMNIDMIGNNLDRAQGMCGASSGSIPTDVGQPLLRVSNITVGGR